MKKGFRKILYAAATLLLILPILLFAVSCSVEPRSEAEVIPESLGKAEGLWLYNGNFRSRTDGTEGETLLSSVIVDGTEYGAEEFEVVKYRYLPATYEIFFIIRIDTDYRLWRYNYLTKSSSELYDLADAEKYYDYELQVSSSLVHVYNKESGYGQIFSRTAQLLCEDFYSGTLNGDMVCRVSNEEFIYFRNGEIHTVSLGAFYSSNEYERYGNFVYFSDSRSYRAVNLETEECVRLAAFDLADENEYRSYVDSYFMGGSLYVLKVRYSQTNEKRLYEFFKITGASAMLEYDFGNVPYGVTMSIDGTTVYFERGAGRDIQKRYFAYDSTTGETRRVSKRTADRGVSAEHLKNKATADEKKLSVGEYTFYVTSIGYDDEPDYFMGGSHYTKTCYYLMRSYGGTEEVMQYSLNTNGGHFFDDICEF